MRSWNNSAPLFLTVVAALLAGCGDKPQENVVAPVQQSGATPNAAPASEITLAVTAPLIVEHQVDIAAQRDGLIAKVSADTGMNVSPTTVLARMDDRQLTANLEAARAKTRGIEADLKNWQAESEVLKADYVRAQRLFNEKLIAQEQLEHAKYKAESDQWDIQRVKEQLNTAKEEEHSLELELEKTRVMPPFSGTVARRYVREGQAVNKGDRLFWVTGEGPLRVRFTLPEKYVHHLKKGDQFTLNSPDLPAEKHNARLIEISPVVDPSSGTIEALAELSGPRGELRPGMTVVIQVPALP
jgi:RND family efflux transporter MFP subunit